MAIKYSLTQRVNPKDVTAPRKFYAIAKSSGEETVRQLATEISKRTLLGSPEVFAALEAFIDLIPERLAEGKIVRLGDFESFKLTKRADLREMIAIELTNRIKNSKT